MKLLARKLILQAMLKFLILFALLPSLYAARIAVTIDDHPIASSPLYSTQERTERFVAALANHSCKAAFFCIGENCLKEKEASCLKLLNDQGHYLANHSFTHPHLSKISLEAFENEILETESILSPYPQMRKWFRYPALDYGNREAMGGSAEKTQASFQILNRLGYQDGYVSINTFDWHLNARLMRALEAQSIIDYEALKSAYLFLLKQWCEYYIEAYQKLLPQEITHTFLLHANDINGLYLEDVLQMLENSGWELVSPELAFQDISWRKKLLNVPHPPILNIQCIDQLLEDFHVFKDQK